MTFKEFSQAIKKDARLMELLNMCDPSCGPMSDEETQEMMERAKMISKSKNNKEIRE